jgi:hypothetical protein
VTSSGNGPDNFCVLVIGLALAFFDFRDRTTTRKAGAGWSFPGVDQLGPPQIAAAGAVVLIACGQGCWIQLDRYKKKVFPFIIWFYGSAIVIIRGWGCGFGNSEDIVTWSDNRTSFTVLEFMAVVAYCRGI